MRLNAMTLFAIEMLMAAAQQLDPSEEPTRLEHFMFEVLDTPVGHSADRYCEFRFKGFLGDNRPISGNGFVEKKGRHNMEAGCWISYSVPLGWRVDALPTSLQAIDQRSASFDAQLRGSEVVVSERQVNRS